MEQVTSVGVGQPEALSALLPWFFQARTELVLHRLQPLGPRVLETGFWGEHRTMAPLGCHTLSSESSMTPTCPPCPPPRPRHPPILATTLSLPASSTAAFCHLFCFRTSWFGFSLCGFPGILFPQMHSECSSATGQLWSVHASISTPSNWLHWLPWPFSEKAGQDG